MSTDMAADANRVNTPVPVEIKNWPDPPAKLPAVKHSTVRTIIVSAAFDGVSVPISDYEPKRIRMVVIPLDAAVAILDHVPTQSPDTSDVTHKADGGVLPNGVQPFEFFGPDAWWLNRLSADTRVTIIKEFSQ
jgi:hypothetical protein